MDHGHNDRVNVSGDNLMKEVGKREGRVMGRVSSTGKLAEC